MATEVNEAVGSIFGGFGSNVSVGAIAGFLLFLLFLFVFISLSIYFIAKYLNSKKYDYRVVIYYQEPGTKIPVLRHDVGGVFLDKKTNLKRFWLRKNNVGLDPDNVNFIFSEAGKKVVTLWQTGVKTFRFAMPSISYNPGFQISVGEEDVNWAITSYDQWKSRFQYKDFLQQYGHILLWGVTIFGTLVLMFFLFQKFDVLAQMAASIDHAAVVLQETGGGTVVK